MRRTSRARIPSLVSAWGVPAAVALAVGALYVCYSLAQWRALVVPSWDLGIFTEAIQAYSRFEAPTVPIKSPGYNLLGDHFHPILALLGPVYRIFPSALTLLVAQDVLLAVSASRTGWDGASRAASPPSFMRCAAPSRCWPSGASHSWRGGGERAWRGLRPLSSSRKTWG